VRDSEGSKSMKIIASNCPIALALYANLICDERGLYKQDAWKLRTQKKNRLQPVPLSSKLNKRLHIAYAKTIAMSTRIFSFYQKTFCLAKRVPKEYAFTTINSHSYLLELQTPQPLKLLSGRGGLFGSIQMKGRNRDRCCV